MTRTTYTNRMNATLAARATLGDSAVEGVDFTVDCSGPGPEGAWWWETSKKAPLILNDLTEQKARIDEQHKALAALMKRFPNHYTANKDDYIIMAGQLCAATMLNGVGEYVQAEELFARAEESIGFLDYKLNDAATDIDF